MCKRMPAIFLALSFIAAASGEIPEPPSAEEIIAKVAETYRAPQRYYMSGVLSGKIRQFPDGIEPTPVVIAVEFPDKLRMEGDLSSLGLRGVTTLVMDGKTAWLYDKASSMYLEIPRVSDPGTPEEKPAFGQADFTRPEQVVSYFDHYLFARYRGSYKKITASEVTGTEILKTKKGRRPCYVVRIDYGDFDFKAPGSGRNVWWVDKDRYRIWKETDSEWLANPAFLQVQSHTFDTVLLDEPLPKNTFYFKPPKGASTYTAPKR